MKRHGKALTIALFLLGAVVLAARAAFSAVTTAASPAAAVTPEVVQAIFDSYYGIIMLVVGLAVSRLPALKNVTNHIIPWLNLVIYVIGKLFVPDAHAGVAGDVGHGISFLWTVARGGAISALTSLFYDKFFKPTLDVVLPKPLPTKA